LLEDSVGVTGACLPFDMILQNSSGLNALKFSLKENLKYYNSIIHVNYKFKSSKSFLIVYSRHNLE